MKYAVIKGRDVTTARELHLQFASAINAPAYYGHNLDAMHDVLTEQSERICIVIEDFCELYSRLGGYFDRFLTVISDSAEENPMINLLMK